MGVMAKKVSPGSPLSASPLHHAGFVNDVVDATAFVKANFLGKGDRSPPAGILTDCVMIRNDTGGNRVRGECVQLGDYLLSALHPLQLWFEGNTPAAPVTQRYALLRDAAPTDGFILAQVSGACIGRVNVGSTSHRFATPAASSHVLTSGETGPIELLQVPGSTGEQDIVVRLGGGGSSGVLMIEFTITAVGPPIEADVDARPDGMTTVPGESGGAVELVNPHSLEIEVGMTGAAWYRDGEWSIFSLTCPA